MQAELQPTLQVLYGQPDHLSTSYQTRQFMRAAGAYFQVEECRVGGRRTGRYAAQLRRLWTNLAEPLLRRAGSDYLFYGNDGFADLHRWKNRRIVYWYDAPWDYAATPPRPRQWKDWLRCENIRCAEYVLAVSALQVRTARRLRPGREDSVHYLPVGVDCQHYDPATSKADEVRARYALPADAVVVGYLGYLGMLDGRLAAQVLVEAAPEVLRREKDVHFLVVGYGPALDPLRRLVGESGLAARFTFTGYVPGELLTGCLASMDLCVDTLEPGFHSEARSETKLKQYLAMGRACVATDLGENRIDLDGGACGCLVAPGAAALSEGIASLIRQPELRQRYSQLARERALALYDWPVLARRMAEAVLV